MTASEKNNHKRVWGQKSLKDINVALRWPQKAQTFFATKNETNVIFDLLTIVSMLWSKNDMVCIPNDANSNVFLRRYQSMGFAHDIAHRI